MIIKSNTNYEKSRPGVVRLKKEYNKLLEDVFGNDLIKVDQILNDKNFFNEDCIHVNDLGHKLIANEVIKKIKN